MIVIIDYGMGNLGSIINMFKKINVNAVISNDPDIIEKADKLLLPGVGSFDNAVAKINSLNLKNILNYQVLEKKKPILGICLGMQLLTRSSEEGLLPGLGWIPADTIKFDSSTGIRIPHMGWNFVKSYRDSPLTVNLELDSKFYFVHSYYVKVDNDENSVFKCSYGNVFDAAIQKDNIFGAQFHPEKSHRYGMQFLQNFANL